jgi:lipoprotein-anchoring transpeptidase ErfK/SrfK
VGGVAAAPADTAADPASLPPDRRPRADLRLEVDLNARKLHVYQGQTRSATHPVAVGSREWPTRTGDWVVSQVVWNPEWVPPDESWAEQRERKAPGAPDNPLGRVQLIYDPPRTIHGTNQPESIGKAVSHGSIRMRNETLAQLGRQVMEVAGVGQDDAWFRRVQENRTEKQVVDLPRVIPIRVF